jgi:hypothetical protein
VKGERENTDGQHGHIICPSWVLHFPVGYSCIEQGLFYLIIFKEHLFYYMKIAATGNWETRSANVNNR